MAAAAQTVRLFASAAALVLSAGCAQFQWSSQGPGAPGSRTSDAPATPVSTDRPLPTFDDGEAPEPFGTSDRERIATVQPWVEQSAQQYSLDPDLINAMIWVESRFVVRAKSPAGARGLMQLMPATANALARQLDRPIARIYDPKFNIEAGSFYLLQMLDRYDGDETLALAAYNAGAGNVSKWMREDGQLPPRSLEYVQHVQRARMRFVAMRDGRVAPGQDSDRTMIAAGPSRSHDRAVPSPPGAAQRPDLTPKPAPQPKAEPKAEPPHNPLAPEPGVYRPTPPLEAPLADTPLPPREPRKAAPTPAASTPPEDADEAVDISTKTSLPSVLD